MWEIQRPGAKAARRSQVRRARCAIRHAHRRVSRVGFIDQARARIGHLGVGCHGGLVPAAHEHAAGDVADMNPAAWRGGDLAMNRRGRSPERSSAVALGPGRCRSKAVRCRAHCDARAPTARASRGSAAPCDGSAAAERSGTHLPVKDKAGRHGRDRRCEYPEGRARRCRVGVLRAAARVRCSGLRRCERFPVVRLPVRAHQHSGRLWCARRADTRGRFNAYDWRREQMHDQR